MAFIRLTKITQLGNTKDILIKTEDIVSIEEDDNRDLVWVKYRETENHTRSALVSENFIDISKMLGWAI